MSSKSKVVFSLLCVVLLATSVAFAQSEDREGSKDHPLISRFPGSVIKHYDVKKFDEYILPLGKLDENKKLSKSQRLEGKITRIQYKAPEDRSTFEIYRNYELALKKAGFEILFAGTLEELGWRWTGQLYEHINDLRSDAGIEIQSEEDFRYLSAKLSSPEGDVYISFCVSLGFWRWPVIQLDVIEVKSMEIGLVTVNYVALKWRHKVCSQILIIIGLLLNLLGVYKLYKSVISFPHYYAKNGEDREALPVATLDMNIAKKGFRCIFAGIISQIIAIAIFIYSDIII